MQKTCTNCQAVFDCAANTPQQTCWCMALPKTTPVGNTDCLCPACLQARITELKKSESKQ